MKHTISKVDLKDLPVLRRLLAENDIPFSPAVMDVVKTYSLKTFEEEVPLSPMLQALRKLN